MAGEALQTLGPAGLIPLRLHKVCKGKGRKKQVRAQHAGLARMAEVSTDMPEPDGEYCCLGRWAKQDSEASYEFSD